MLKIAVLGSTRGTDLQPLLDQLRPGRKVTEQGVLSAAVVGKYLQKVGFKMKKPGQAHIKSIQDI